MLQLKQNYEWAVGSSETAIGDILPWTSVGVAYTAASSTLEPVLQVGQSIIVAVRATNGAGATSAVAFSASATVGSTECPHLDDSYRAVGINLFGDTPVASLGDDTSDVVYAPYSFGIGVQWNPLVHTNLIELGRAALTWEVRRFDTWDLVMPAKPLVLESMATESTRTTLERPQQPSPTREVAMFQTQALELGVSYVVVVTSTCPSGNEHTYMTNRVVFAGVPPAAGQPSAGAAHAEARVEWLGNPARVGVSWSTFDDSRAGVHHFEVCMARTGGSGGSGGIGTLDTFIEPHSAAVAVLPGAATEADTFVTVDKQFVLCADAQLANRYTFSSDQTAALLGTGGGHGESATTVAFVVTAVSNAGLSRSVISDTVAVDFQKPARGVVAAFAPTVSNHQVDQGTLEVVWTDFRVNGAPIVDYYVGVGREVITDVQELPEALESYRMYPAPFVCVGLDTKALLTTLWLLPGTPYYATVVGVTASGARQVAQARPLTIHQAPPVITHVYDVFTSMVIQDDAVGGNDEAPVAPLTAVQQLLQSDDTDEREVNVRLWDMMVAAGDDLEDRYEDPTDPAFVELTHELLVTSASAVPEPSPVQTVGEATNTRDDIDFQSGTSYYSVAWEVNAASAEPTHFLVQVMRRAPSLTDMDVPVLPDFEVAAADQRSMTFNGLELEVGALHYAVVRAVTGGGLYSDKLSDGVLIDRSPACLGEVQAKEHGAVPMKAEHQPRYVGSALANSMDVTWLAVVDPGSDTAGVNALCSVPEDLEGELKFDYDGSGSGIGMAAGSANAAQVEFLRQLGPIKSFTVSLVQVSIADAGRLPHDISDDSGSNASASSSPYEGVRPLTSAELASLPSASVVESRVVQTSEDYVFPDPICCTASLPAVPEQARSMEPDVSITEIQDASSGLNNVESPKDGSDAGVDSTTDVEGVGSTPQPCSQPTEEQATERRLEGQQDCGRQETVLSAYTRRLSTPRNVEPLAYGRTVALMADELIAVGGTHDSVVMSVQDAGSRLFRWVQNLVPDISSTVAVKVVADGHHAAFVGADTLQVMYIDAGTGTAREVMAMQQVDASAFQAGSFGTAVALSSVQSPRFPASRLTLVAVSRRHVLTSEGIVAVFSIDDVTKISRIAAYIQPSLLFDKAVDTSFGSVLAMHEGCLLAWGSVTGVVLACLHSGMLSWMSAIIPHPCTSQVLCWQLAHVSPCDH